MTKAEAQTIRELCRNGAFEPFAQMCDQIMEGFQDIQFTSTDRIVYDLGKRDGAKQFKSDLLDTIESLAKQ